MAYPSDVKDDEWSFGAPYLCLMNEDAPQRAYALRDVFNGLRYLAHTDCPWRYLPGDLPPLGHALPAVDPLAGRARIRDYRA